MLNAQRMATNIKRLTHILKKNQLIIDESQFVMQEAAAYVQSFPKDNWELFISPEKPLEFVQAQSDKRLRPDIFCKIKTESQDDCAVSDLGVVIRVWSTEQAVSFRPEWDSQELNRKLGTTGLPKRVMFRCHYDKRSTKEYAPLFHLQFGGVSRDDEFCWLPHNLELPRFPSPPMDLVLTCELVIATFFPYVYRRLSEDGNWTSVIKESERHFMREYFKIWGDYGPQRCHQTLLDYLCSPTP